MSEFDDAGSSGRKGFVRDVMRRISASDPRPGDEPERNPVEELEDALRVFGGDSAELRHRLERLLAEYDAARCRYHVVRQQLGDAERQNEKLVHALEEAKQQIAKPRRRRTRGKTSGGKPRRKSRRNRKSPKKPANFVRHLKDWLPGINGILTAVKTLIQILMIVLGIVMAPSPRGALDPAEAGAETSQIGDASAEEPCSAAETSADDFELGIDQVLSCAERASH